MAARIDPKLTVLALALAAVAWAVVTYYLLTVAEPPGSELGAGDGGVPQWVLPTLGHFGLFAGLSVLLFAPVFTGTPLRRHPYLAAAGVVVVAALYGGGLELYQTTLPARYASWMDGFVNFAGAASGVVAVLAYTELRRRLRSTKPT